MLCFFKGGENKESRQCQEGAGKHRGFTKKIGNTTYDVSFHYSRQSTESMNDKIVRIIENYIQIIKNS